MESLSRTATTLADEPKRHSPDTGTQNVNLSRVDIDSVDPIGMQELRRTLSDQQAEHSHRDSFYSSDVTLHGSIDPEKFDFEKTLRAVVRK